MLTQRAGTQGFTCSLNTRHIQSVSLSSADVHRGPADAGQRGHRHGVPVRCEGQLRHAGRLCCHAAREVQRQRQQ